ncbi:retinol dehydrogenase 12 [Xylariaceae sp. FL0255]|nr:retinol dehydrogenase 12 [Xylariaceae sp. FL0255]
MGQFISQNLPPAPKLTEVNLPDQAGKVFIVTGATSGVGKALARILYGANGKVYITARSEEKANTTIAELKKQRLQSKGQLTYLHLELSDLSLIKASVDTFLAHESRLHVLFNNAGVMFTPPETPKTKQGYEIQLGTNALGPFLFTQLLTPILLATAREEEGRASIPGSVRVVWASSSFASYFTPPGAIDMNNLDYQKSTLDLVKYSSSKAAIIFYSAEFARRYGKDNIISIPLDPGNLRTGLHRHRFFFWLAVQPFLHDALYGAYTELFAGFSPDITLDKNNAFLAPWGRIIALRSDIDNACKTTDEGGSGAAQAFWEWSEQQVQAYL